MKKLDFTVPFSGFASTTFVNCFASVYMYLEKIAPPKGPAALCNQWLHGQCNSCGNCAHKPQALQERYFFLFDTLCGRSALRLRYDGVRTEADSRINGSCGEAQALYDGGGAENIDFLFGLAGYDYHTVTAPCDMHRAVAGSIDAGRPVIVKLRGHGVPFCVLIGYGDDGYRMPDFRAAQAWPERPPREEELEAAYIVDGRRAPRYGLLDGLKRIERVMEENEKAGLWDGYRQKMGTYGEDSLGQDGPAGRQGRMARLAETMWYTFNCHNFAEVFRGYLDGGPFAHAFDGMGDMALLGQASLEEALRTISWRYGYTHDLAWSLIGLSECIRWDDWKSHYYGDMLEVILRQIKENDEAVLRCVRDIIGALEGAAAKTE